MSSSSLGIWPKVSSAMTLTHSTSIYCACHVKRKHGSIFPCVHPNIRTGCTATASGSSPDKPLRCLVMSNTQSRGSGEQG